MMRQETKGTRKRILEGIDSLSSDTTLLMLQEREFLCRQKKQERWTSSSCL